MQIIAADLDNPSIVALLQAHRQAGQANSAPGSAHALDLSGFRTPDIRLWAAWEDGDLLGLGALRRLDATHGEVKSMHTVETRRRGGIGSALLRHIIAEARAERLQRLSLETGSWAYFRPAVALYARHGFTECPPFGDYQPDPNSIFMTLDLTRPAAAPARSP